MSVTAGAFHRVLLLRDRDDPTLYKARPAFALVSREDKVQFVNRTEATVLLTFPFEGDPFGQGPIEIGSGLRSSALTVVGNDNRYRYKGKVNNVEDALKGESSPEIIIDG